MHKVKIPFPRTYYIAHVKVYFFASSAQGCKLERLSFSIRKFRTSLEVTFIRYLPGTDPT